MLLKRAFGAGLLLASAVVLVAQAGMARATDRHGFSLACADGRSFQIRPSAVSDEGDLVTGYLIVRRHRAVPIRLIPMGEGYRYAGPGLWLDGVGGDAVLDWGTRRSVPCTLQRS